MSQSEPDGSEPAGFAKPNQATNSPLDSISTLRDRGVNVPDGTAPEVVDEVLRIVSTLWLDGKAVPLESFYIDPSDEGLLYGRGVWESTRTINGIPWLWLWHMERLRGTAQILGIHLTAERLPTAEQVTGFVRTLTTQDVVIRLNVTAGRAGKPGLVWMSAALQPVSPASIRLQTCPSPFPKGQPYLTLKTFQYATRLRLAQQAFDAGFDTALLVDAEDNLLEASSANLFVRLPEGWATPAADGGLLPGTVRQFLLRQGPFPIVEQKIPLARLPEIREAFISNSNVGVVPVTRIDQHVIPIGEDTRNLNLGLQPPTTGEQFRFVETRAPRR